MAMLSSGDKDKIWRGLMRYWSRQKEETPDFDKNDFRTSVDDTDTWVDDNQGNYNTSLNLTFRNNATMLQKTVLLCAVMAFRAEPEFAKQLFGDLD